MQDIEGKRKWQLYDFYTQKVVSYGPSCCPCQQGKPPGWHVWAAHQCSPQSPVHNLDPNPHLKQVLSRHSISGVKISISYLLLNNELPQILNAKNTYKNLLLHAVSMGQKFRSGLARWFWLDGHSYSDYQNVRSGLPSSETVAGEYISKMTYFNACQVGARSW